MSDGSLLSYQEFFWLVARRGVDDLPRAVIPQPGLDKIKTFRDRSLNFSKLSVKVRKLRQQNLQQKVQNL